MMSKSWIHIVMRLKNQAVDTNYLDSGKAEPWALMVTKTVLHSEK